MRSPREFNEELVRRYMRWMVMQRYAISTQKFYVQILKAYGAFLQRKMITAATHNDVLEFLASEAARGQSLQSLHHKLDILRVFYDFLRIGGMQAHAPARLIRLRPVRRQIPRILSEEEVERLIAHSRNQRDRVLIELLYGTGCRISEVTEIRLENIDFRARTIRVFGKGRTRIVLFGRKAERAILAYVGDRRQGYLFTSDMPSQWGSVLRSEKSWVGKWMDYGREDGKPAIKQRSLGHVSTMSFWEARGRLTSLLRHEHARRPDRERPPRPVTLQMAVAKVAHRAGLGNVTPRMLRHTFATHLLNGGADIRVIQELMGHAWIQTTQVYTQVSREKLAATFRHCHPRGV
jgi:site-specific recombinase XerD